MFEGYQYSLSQVDPEIFTALLKIEKRQEDYPRITLSWWLQFVDVIEQLAIDWVKALYGAEAANVQPDSGSQANQGVFLWQLS